MTGLETKHTLTTFPARAAVGAISGLGAVSSIGDTVDACFAALLDGTDGLAPLQVFDPTHFGARSAYELRDRPSGVDRPWRATELLVQAVGEAMRTAGLTSLEGIPVLVGTGLREMRSAELAWLDGSSIDPERLHFGPALREAFGAADVHTFSNACSASLYALGLAGDMLAMGHDVVVVGGVDVLTASMYGLLDRVHLDPPDRVRPFDAARKGVLIGEGAAAVVLVRDSRSPVLGARLPLLRATALGCDAHHVTAPDAAQIESSMRAAHEMAGVAAADIDIVYTHGTGTHLNDEAEATALQRVFGGQPRRPAMAAVKAMTGHTSGGSGLFSLAMAVQSLRTGLVPGVLGLAELGAAAQQLDLSAETRTVHRPRLAQVDAFGFGGLNAVAVIEEPQ